MKAKKVIGLIPASLLFVGACLGSFSARAQSASPQETLNQYVADLQKNPDDTALREKIIALALTMTPPPEVPAEARRHMSRGVAAVEGAKTPDDFKDACNEFQQVTMLAPWLANAYRNLAIAQNKAGMYDDALASLRLYLLTRPSSADADWAEDLKAKVEYRKEKAAKEVEAKAKESSPEAIAARTQNAFEVFLNKIDGRRYTYSYGTAGAKEVIDVRRGRFVMGLINAYTHWEYTERNDPFDHPAIQGFETVVPMGRVPDMDVYIVDATFRIREDGSTIIRRTRYNTGTTADDVFLWQR